MLVDPITVAAAAPTPALSFSVVQFDGMRSVREDNTNNWSLVIEHTKQKPGTKHYMQIKQRLLATSPTSGTQAYQEATASLTIFVPTYGFDNTAMVALVKALTDTLADADVTTLKLLQNQS